MRTFTLTSSLLLAAVGVFPVLVACGGREVSLGTNKAQLSQVDPHAVGGNVPSCGAGDAHPNVCCEAGAGKAGTCGVYLGAPFQPCDTGWTTYPDPRSCCALDDPQNCVAPPPTPPAPPPGVCGYACEPGWYPIQNGCCQSTSNGDGVCYGWASGGSDGGRPDAGVIDAGGVDADVGDASWSDSGCAPSIDGGGSCDPQPPPSSVCDFACPSGWQHPTGTPDVCCRDVGGQIECFSQATGPTGPGTGPDGGVVDAGTPSTDAGPAPFICGGTSTGDCSCQATVGGHNYELQCSDSAQLCTCIEDGVGTSTSGVMVCGSGDGGATKVDSFWTTNCHFPR